MRLRRMAVVIAIAIGLGGPAAAQSTDRLNVLVPAYFYPSGTTNLGYWNQLSQAAGQVSLTVIVNPNNGVFSAADPNYTTVINDLRTAGATSIGYVFTQGGARDINLVKANIDSYAAVYNAGNPNNIRGIFIDEMPVNPTAGQLTYYRDLYQHIATNHPAWVGQVFGNPGANTASTAALLDSATRGADRLVVSEMTYGTYQQSAAAPAPWVLSNPDRNRFAHLIHTTPGFDAAGLDQALQLAIQRNAGYVYFTDDVFLNPGTDNPWDTLSSYWNTEVNRVMLTPVPEPAAVTAVAAAGLTAGWVARRTRRRQG